MTKEFVPYEEALGLREIGFDEDCFGYYSAINEGRLCRFEQLEHKYCRNSLQPLVTAILYQQAFRWFREKYNLYSEITLDSYKEPYSLKVTIKHLDNTNTFVNKEYHPYSNGIGDIDNKKYEEAELECLKQLIKIVTK